MIMATPRKLYGQAFGCCLVLAVAAAPRRPDPSPVLQAMSTELARSMAQLRTQPTPPYFISYDVTELQATTVVGSFGAITESGETRTRHLDVELRVGDRRFDNTHQAAGGFAGFEEAFDFGDRFTEVPLDDDSAAIRAALWYATDAHYRRAVQQLARVRAGAEVQVQPDDSSPDFSAEPAEHYAEARVALVIDRAAWEDRIRRYTAPFAKYDDIYDARAELVAAVETRWYVNSDGSVIQTSQPMYRLFLSAYSKADDGMELPRYESFYALTPAGLPSDTVVLRAVDKMIVDLHALQHAPVIDPYTGPAILSGRASAVFFHEVFGHRIEGHREKRGDEGQTFKHKVNQLILPHGFSVVFDPTLRQLGATDLAGYYRYDDEGVRAQRVTVVDDGVFKSYLMSRSPIEGFAHSNGHGRREVGFMPVARQSNLIVEATQPRSRAELTQMLIDRIKSEHKPFGLFFDDIEGGFTITARGTPNAFNVLPVMVYRVFPDGRQELVRGVDFIGTPLTAFSKIVVGDDRPAVFNGMCGAESGFVPVSAVSPDLLVAQVEIQRKVKSDERRPILPPPPDRPR